MKNRFAQYFAIEKRILEEGYVVTREKLISDFTDNRKKGLKELTEVEYLFFIHWLQQNYPAPLNAPNPMTGEQMGLDLMRKKIIALFRKMGYNIGNEADMKRIYSWVNKYGYLKKKLNEYTADELPMLVSQVERVYKSTLA